MTEMEYFDGLPARFRELLRNVDLPKLSAQSVYLTLSFVNEDKFYNDLCKRKVMKNSWK